MRRGWSRRKVLRSAGVVGLAGMLAACHTRGDQDATPVSGMDAEAMATATPLVQVQAADYYVSPLGNDSWSGRLAGANAAGSDGPVATLAQALKLARKGSGPQKIVMRGGAYYDVAVELDGRDSELTIEAAEGEEPILYGGHVLQGWEPDGDRFWKVDLPEVAAGRWDFRLLVVNGRIRPRARLPQVGAFKHNSEFNVPWMSTTLGGWAVKPTHEQLTTLKYSGDDLGDWLVPENAEITVYHHWDDSMVGVKSIDTATRTVTFSSETGHPPGAFGTWDPKARTYVVWNVREGLTQPGQWYLDRAEGKVVYWPFEGEDLISEETEVLVPTTECILRLVGDGHGPIEKVTLRGLRFEITTTPLIAGGFGATNLEGAIGARGYVRDLLLENVRVRNVAGTGIKLREYNKRHPRAHIEHCSVEWAGAGGIYLSADNFTISDCLVQHIGVIYPAAIGIMTSGNKGLISHNDVWDISYAAMNISDGTGCVVEGNDIRRAMQTLLDGAAIYAIFARELVMRGNVARDIASHDGRCHAYYLDEQSEDCVVEGNLAINVPSAVQNHMAHNNRIEGNLFVCEGDMLLNLPRSDGYTLGRNVCYATGEIRIRNMGAITTWERNLFYTGAGVVWAEYFKEDGYTTESLDRLRPGEDTVFGDPLFVSIPGEDFSYQEGSPALRLGIEPIDVSQVGRRSR